SMLDDFGLTAALNWYMERQAERVGFAAHIIIDQVPNNLSPAIATTCFRVVQEAVTNTVRHAQAKDMWVELHRYGQQLVLNVRDNGDGFDVNAAQERATRGFSMGLPGMYERVRLVGGQLTIRSTPSCGTEISVTLPLEIRGES